MTGLPTHIATGATVVTKLTDGSLTIWGSLNDLAKVQGELRELIEGAPDGFGLFLHRDAVNIGVLEVPDRLRDDLIEQISQARLRTRRVQEILDDADQRGDEVGAGLPGDMDVGHTEFLVLLRLPASLGRRPSAVTSGDGA